MLCLRAVGPETALLLWVWVKLGVPLWAEPGYLSGRPGGAVTSLQAPGRPGSTPEWHGLQGFTLHPGLMREPSGLPRELREAVVCHVGFFKEV